MKEKDRLIGPIWDRVWNACPGSGLKEESKRYFLWGWFVSRFPNLTTARDWAVRATQEDFDLLVMLGRLSGELKDLE